MSVEVGEVLTCIEGMGTCSTAAPTETDLTEKLQRTLDPKLPTDRRESIADHRYW